MFTDRTRLIAVFAVFTTFALHMGAIAQARRSAADTAVVQLPAGGLLAPVTGVGRVHGSLRPEPKGSRAGIQAPTAFTIVVVPGAGLAANPQALAAFNAAAASWAARITDNITITISADLSPTQSGGAPFPPGIIAVTNPVLLQAGYSTIRDAVVADAAASASTSDNIATSMPTAGQFLAQLPAGGWSLSGSIVATKANAKALGFANLDGTFGVSDGSVLFNSTAALDYDRSNGVSAGTLDFQTLAMYTLGRVLGFTSGVDTIDTTAPGAVPFTTLDLYRFSLASTPATPAAFTNNARSFVPGAEAVTSDTVNSPRMSTGANGGDGRGASNWKDDSLLGTLIGVMDPTLPTGTMYNQTAADFLALDLIGYDVAAPTAANVSVSGRVTTPDGRGIRNARITLDGGTGQPVTAVTNAFGYYRFEGIPAGRSYVMNAASRGHIFVPRVVSVVDQLANFDVVALP